MSSWLLGAFGLHGVQETNHIVTDVRLNSESSGRGVLTNLHAGNCRQTDNVIEESRIRQIGDAPPDTSQWCLKQIITECRGDKRCKDVLRKLSQPWQLGMPAEDLLPQVQAVGQLTDPHH